MCVGCHGTCGAGKAPAPPRFTQHAGGPNLVVVGTSAGPTQGPDALVRLQGNMLTYESLYTGLGPDGRPALLGMPGTFGSFATRAGKGR